MYLGFQRMLPFHIINHRKEVVQLVVNCVGRCNSNT